MEPRSLEGMAAFIRRVREHLAAPTQAEPAQSIPAEDSPAAAAPEPCAGEHTPPHPPTQPTGQPEHAAEANDWQVAQAALESGETQEATVVGWNRGGLLVHWRGLQGFLPASQLQRMIRYTSDAERDAAFAGRVGEALRLKVIEVDYGRKRLVFSERAAVRHEGCNACAWEDLAAGQVRRGRVRNLCDFGAFVDLGGIDGLIHISELAWRHVKHPADALQIGQEIDVFVMSVEPDRKRVALSVKKLRPDPWETVAERYHIGQVVRATITNVLSFGAFAHLEEGVEELIHVSELGEGSAIPARGALCEGEAVLVCITSIEPASRRLALSLRYQGTEPDAGAQTNDSSG